MPAAIPIAASVAGAAVSGAMSKRSSSGGQSSKQEPWSAVQPWLKENIEGGQALQDYYQRNSFNPIQQAGYQNLLGDFDSFRHGAAPGLMAYANKLMGANYQRAPAGSELGGLNPYAPGNGNNFNSPNVGLLSQGGLNALATALQSAARTMPALNPSGSWQDAVAQMGSGQSGSPPSGAMEAAIGQMQGVRNPMQGQSMGWADTQATPMPKPYLHEAGAGQAQGVFSSPAGVGYTGLLDWASLNPWTGILAQREEDEKNKPKTDPKIEELVKQRARWGDTVELAGGA